MADYLELVGVPGVGKSTVHRVLCRRRWQLGGRRLVYPPARGGIESAWFSTMKRILRIPDKPTRATFTLDAVEQQYSEFCSYCWQVTDRQRSHNHLGQDVRLSSAYALYEALRTLGWIRAQVRKRLYLVEEGLLQKSFSITVIEACPPETMEEYFARVPAPEEAFWLQASNETLCRRLLGRERLIPAHRQRSDEALCEWVAQAQSLLATGMQVLKQRGVVVHEIDTERPVRDVVTDIEQRIMMYRAG